MAEDIGTLVLQAPDSIWAQLKKALRVETREQAAELVRTDSAAQKVAVSILSGSQSLLTKPEARSESLLTSPKRKEKPVADRMYGKQPKVTF